MMTTFIHTDFDTYCAIQEMVFSIFADELDADFEDVVTFSASLGVIFTEADWLSLGIDFDEI